MESARLTSAPRFAEDAHENAIAYAYLHLLYHVKKVGVELRGCFYCKSATRGGWVKR